MRTHGHTVIGHCKMCNLEIGAGEGIYAGAWFCRYHWKEANNYFLNKSYSEENI